MPAYIRALSERLARALRQSQDDFPRAALQHHPVQQSTASSSNSLAQHLDRVGDTGRGANLVRSREQEATRSPSGRERSRSRGPDDDIPRERTAFKANRTAFNAERFAIPLGTNKNVRKQLLGKNLKYDQCDAATRSGLNKSRAKEWNKWMDFNAGVIVEGEVLSQLLNEGNKMLPTQWIETDQNDHLKRPGVAHTPEYKSRLVACGQFEETEGIRTDSPTADVEALNLVCSFAACGKLKIKCADIRNAYFNAEPLDRLMLLRPPRGGLPGIEKDKYAVAARLPIYGTKDAGRQFYKKFRYVATSEVKLKECRKLKSLYSYAEDGDIQFMLAAHVDDLMWVAKPGYEYLADQILSHFEIKKIEESKFRFCGREYLQEEDFSVYVSCKDNTEKILPINFDKKHRRDDDKASAGEIGQM